MLEYIAICNAAYSTIKKAIENGRELSSVAKVLVSLHTQQMICVSKKIKRKIYIQ